MILFTARPQRALLNLCLAIAVGAVIGSLVWWMVDGLPAEPSEGVASQLVGALVLMVPVFGVGAAVLLLYALPAVWVLQRLGWAGPASVLLVAMTPAAALALVPDLRSLALIVGGFGLTSGLTFALLAYRRTQTSGQA
jgi:hypothetical protein